MYKIEVADLATDSPDFGVVKRAVLDRYDRLHEQHVPNGRLTYRRDASQREIVAGTYTAIVLSHAQVAATAFDSELYASGFALMRPMLEALLKQHMVGCYNRDDDGWKNDIDAQPRITKSSLKKLAERGIGLHPSVARSLALAQRLRTRWVRTAEQQSQSRDRRA